MELDPSHRKSHNGGHQLTLTVKHRELMVNQRTQAINALRGHAAEFGIIAAQGCANVAALLAALSSEDTIPAVAKGMFEQMGQHVADLDAKIDALEKQLLEQHKTNAVSKLLAAIPGVGPITAITMALTVNPASFESGRHFAAWIGACGRRDGRDPLRQTRQQVGYRLAVTIAGASAAEGRSGRSG